jgi:uncharacterized Zn finger protein
MSPRHRGGRFPEYAPKKPAPEHGVKLEKLGATWWGQRWIAALEHVLGADAGRLARGRTYARAGRTHDFSIHDGKVKARVTGSRPEPYHVEIALAQLPPDVWAEAIAGMASKAQFAAELLAGQMPKHIDDVFRAAGAGLFPTERSALQTSCTCPDWGDPCKHVAAAYYVLGEALDRDPFLLFELRGRDEAQVRAELRARRGEGAELEVASAPSVVLGELRSADYDKAPRTLPVLSFSFEAPAKSGALLRQLGAPSSWHGATSPVDALAPIVRQAAESARRLALGEPELPGEPEPSGTAPRTLKKRATARRRR